MFGPQTAYGACSLGSGSKVMNFSAPSNNGDCDLGQTTAAGWGAGTLLQPHAQGAFPSLANNPARLTTGIRMLAADTGKVALYGDATLPLVYISDTGTCHVGFWRFSNPSNLSTLYANPPTLNTAVNYVIDASASCAPGVALAVSPVDTQTFSKSPKADVVVVTPKNINFEGTVLSAALYIADPSASSNTFQKVDITAILQQAGIAFHSGSPIALSDVDGDGRADLLIASSHDNVNELVVFYATSGAGTSYTFASYETLIPDLGFTPPFANAANPITLSYSCADSTSIVSRGVSGLTRADVDNDGIMDILATSMSESGIHYFQGTSATTFARQTDIAAPDPANKLEALAYDFTMDTHTDIMSIRAGRGCQGKPGEGQLLRNDGFENFYCINPTYEAKGVVYDWAARLKNDMTGQVVTNPWYQTNIGVIAGKITDSGDYTIWSNFPSSAYYTLSSVAVSRSLTYGVPNLGNLVDVTIGAFGRSQPAGTSLALYVSADNGTHYEPLTASELAGSTPHQFNYFGTDLRWKAVFSSNQVSVTSDNPLYAPAASATPTLSSLALAYRYAGPLVFSRSDLAYGQYASGGGNVDFAYAASFNTPNMTGHLVALPLASYTSGGAGGLQNVAPSGTWDAASTVASLAPTSRKVFSNQRTASLSYGNIMSYPLRTIVLNAAQLTAPSNNPLLQVQMQLRSQSASSQLTTILAGGNPNGQSVLRDPGHCSPVFVGPPDEDPNYMGFGYAGYIASQKAARAPFVLLGANDGMLHAFAAQTGQELWGMVPSNLLSMLGDQTAFDSNGLARYAHQTLVDGPITVVDVYSSSTGWRTVALVGQAQGTSASGSNYYHAVDVTNASSPNAMWELAEGLGGGTTPCNSYPCTGVVCNYAIDNNTPFEVENDIYQAEMDINAPKISKGDGATYGLLEAEHFDSTWQANTGATGSWTVVSGSTPPANTARNNSYITPSPSASSCTGASLSSAEYCPSVTYPLWTTANSAGDSFYPMFRIFYTPGQISLSYTIDNQVYFSGQPTFTGTTPGTWQWAYGSPVSLSVAEHTLTVFMASTGLKLDAVAMKATSVPPVANDYETPQTRFIRAASAPSCAPTCVSNPANSEWPECGIGQGQKCCDNGFGQGYCQPVGLACNSPVSNTGQTFSPPAVGRVRTSAGDKWVAFFGSGYKSAPGLPNMGRSIYMVEVLTGIPMGTWNLPIPAGASSPNIDVTIPGGVTTVDTDGDGYVDRLYVGDTAGRLWKLDTSASASLTGQGGMSNAAQYPSCVLFDAGSPNGASTRQWAPISSKPAVLIVTSGHPNVYFGTGGDAQAPNTVAYSFYSVQDTDNAGSCMATPRLATSLTAANNEWIVTEPAGSGQFWSDPTVVDNTSVYFSSSNGNPDSIDPCVASGGSSHVYGIAARSYVDSGGTSHKTGTSIFAAGAKYYTASGVIRAAAVARGRSVPQVVRQSTALPSTATDVLLQNYTANVMRISSGGVTSVGSNALKITRIREVAL